MTIYIKKPINIKKSKKISLFSYYKPKIIVISSKNRYLPQIFDNCNP